MAYDLKPNIIGSDPLRVISHMAGWDARVELQTLRIALLVEEARSNGDAIISQDEQFKAKLKNLV